MRLDALMLACAPQVPLALRLHGVGRAARQRQRRQQRRVGAGLLVCGPARPLSGACPMLTCKRGGVVGSRFWSQRGGMRAPVQARRACRSWKRGRGAGSSLALVRARRTAAFRPRPANNPSNPAPAAPFFAGGERDGDCGHRHAQRIHLHRLQLQLRVCKHPGGGELPGTSARPRRRGRTWRAAGGAGRQMRDGVCCNRPLAAAPGAHCSLLAARARPPPVPAVGAEPGGGAAEVCGGQRHCGALRHHLYWHNAAGHIGPGRRAGLCLW